MKKVFCSLYSKILEYSRDNYLKSSVSIIFDEVVNISDFNNFLSSVECREDFFYPSIISFDNLENSNLRLFRIIIIMKILRGYFSADIGYSQVFEYAGDLSDFISDFYVFNLSKEKLKEFSRKDNNFDFIVRFIEVYERFLDFLWRDDVAVIYRRYFISTISLIDKVLHVPSKKKNIGRYNNVLDGFCGKIEKLPSHVESRVLRDDVRIFYNEFSSIFDRANFIAFYIYQRINESERVVVVSDNEELNDIILFNIKKMGDDTDEIVHFSKTELYKVLIGVTEIFNGCNALCIVDLMKSSCIDLDDCFVSKFESVLRSVQVVESDVLALIERFKKQFSTYFFEEKSMEILNFIYDAIKNYVSLNEADSFTNWLFFHKNIIKKIIKDKYELIVDSFFYFVDDYTKGILDEKIFFSDYVDILKKISEFFYVPSNGSSEKKFAIISSFSARFFNADYVLFADVSEEFFPKKEKNNYWVNEFDREKLGLIDKFSIEDFYDSINSAEKSCLIIHSDVDGAKRSHFIDVLLNEYAERIETYDLTNYRSYEASLLRDVKAFFLKNAKKPVLPSPSPDVSIRPKKISATEIGYLVKNPYKIYAKHVLSVKELNFYNIGVKYISKGNIVHEIMHDIFQNNKDWNFDADTGLIDKLWGYNLGKLYEYYADEVKNFGENYQKSYLEVSAKLMLGEFTIIARADRVDIFKDGGISIIDYKTGTLPSKNSIKEMINPQILVEGIIFKYGNVPIPNIRFIRQLKLVKLPQKLGVVDVEEKNTELDELIESSKDKLLCILENSLKDPYEAYNIKEHNMENDPVFLLSRAHEVLY